MSERGFMPEDSLRLNFFIFKMTSVSETIGPETSKSQYVYLLHHSYNKYKWYIISIQFNVTFVTVLTTTKDRTIGQNTSKEYTRQFNSRI